MNQKKVRPSALERCRHKCDEYHGYLESLCRMSQVDIREEGWWERLRSVASATANAGGAGDTPKEDLVDLVRRLEVELAVEHAARVDLGERVNLLQAQSGLILNPRLMEARRVALDPQNSPPATPQPSPQEIQS